MKQAALVLLLCPAALAAQADPAPDPLARKVMRNFGTCVAAAAPNGAKQVLALDYRTPEYRGRIRRLVQENRRCLPVGGRLEFQQVIFAGGLAEAMLPGGLPAQVADKTLPEPRDTVEQLHLCSVRAAPAEVEAVFATTAGSPEEGVALRSLQPIMAHCLQNNAALRINMAGARAMLALAAYRIVATGGSTPAAGS